MMDTLWFICDGVGFCLFNVDHVRVMLDTAAVYQEVCLADLFRKLKSLRQALKVNLSSSHSQRNCLFFLVNGLRLGKALITKGSHMLMFCRDLDPVPQWICHQ